MTQTFDIETPLATLLSLTTIPISITKHDKTGYVVHISHIAILWFPTEAKVIDYLQSTIHIITGN